MRQIFRGWRSARTWAATDQSKVAVITYYPLSSKYFTTGAIKILKRFWRSVNNNVPKEVRKPFGNVEARDPISLGRSRSLCALNTNATQFSNSPFAGIREVAHQLFVNNVLRRVSSSQNSELRRRTVRQLFGGNSAPFFALVGVSLASGSGIITKEDEIECVCSEVRQTARKTRDHLSNGSLNDLEKATTTWTLKDFDIGPAIAKGCSAVVYSAKCLVEGFQTIGQQHQAIDQNEQEFPLALKMMFNFHAESNAPTILKAMQKELLVAQNIQDSIEDESIIKKNETVIGPHPNIVKVYTAFIDKVPSISDSMELYPDALPSRINPNGYGRNMSMFLVMKRYKTNLQTYLQQNEMLSWRSSLITFTQILEGLVHLSRYKIAHRDLKTDNILLEYSEDERDNPMAVISDFGCSWYNPQYGFLCPYLTSDVDKGGNAALMAPEVANATPGIFSFINYSKADVWAAGAIAYELFGFKNPFYHTMDRKGLDSRRYRMSDLPALTSRVPKVIDTLVKHMLIRNPAKRLSAEEAATICQLILWAPKSWTCDTYGGVPKSQDILQWLLAMTTKTLYECRYSNKPSAHLEYQLVATFLSRSTVEIIKKSLNWIQVNASEA